MKTIRHMSENLADLGGWKGRHSRAVERGLSNVNGHRGCFPGDSLVQAVNAWCEYAAAHKRIHESEIGEDHYIGPVWCKWGLSLRDLLNGESGDLDCGTLDTILHDNLTEQGFKEGVDW